MKATNGQKLMDSNMVFVRRSRTGVGKCKGGQMYSGKGRWDVGRWAHSEIHR